MTTPSLDAPGQGEADADGSLRAVAADHVEALTTDAAMTCNLCPITLAVERFAVLVANGWNQRHTFQQPEFNNNHVIVCDGHFSLTQPHHLEDK